MNTTFSHRHNMPNPHHGSTPRHHRDATTGSSASQTTERIGDLSEGWLPETPLMLSPSLACRVGAEEALLVTVLRQCAQALIPQTANGHSWYTVDETTFQQIAPFWRSDDIQRLSLRLRELGVLLIASAPITQAGRLKFAFRTAPSNYTVELNNPTEFNNTASLSPLSNEPIAAKPIAPHWQPEQETIMRLAQHGIPSTFVLEQVSEFVTYWRGVNETKRNWDSPFLQHVIQQWRIFETRHSSAPKHSTMTPHWRPSEDAMEVLTKHAGISRSFIEDAVPEFVLYWREQGTTSDNWNRRFRDHVNRQWAKYHSALEHDTTPRRINDGWTPSRDVYDVLQLANIDSNFANQLVPEFVIYWRDSNQTHSSWNTKFLQYVKRRWAQYQTERERGTAPAASTRDLSLDALVNDRSWAD